MIDLSIEYGNANVPLSCQTYYFNFYNLSLRTSPAMLPDLVTFTRLLSLDLCHITFLSFVLQFLYREVSLKFFFFKIRSRTKSKGRNRVRKRFVKSSSRRNDAIMVAISTKFFANEAQVRERRNMTVNFSRASAECAFIVSKRAARRAKTISGDSVSKAQLLVSLHLWIPGASR